MRKVESGSTSQGQSAIHQQVTVILSFNFQANDSVQNIQRDLLSPIQPLETYRRLFIQRGRQGPIRSLASVTDRFVTLGRLLNLSVSQLLHLQNEAVDIHLLRALRLNRCLHG